MTKIRRPDLEAQPVKFPGYIGHMIAPWLEKNQTAGKLYYQALRNDFDVQSGRDTANIGTINVGATLTPSSMDYACVEKRARVRMGYDIVATYGGQEKADLAMGRDAKRSFFNAYEQTIADGLLKTTSTDITEDPVAGIDQYVADLMDLARGPVALCLSHLNFVKLKNNATVKDRLKNTGIAINAGGDPRQITAEQLAIIFNCDKVLVGPDAQWYTGVTGSYNGNCALVVLPDENAEPIEEPQFARTVYYAWNTDAKYFYMESFEDDLTDASYVDAKGHYVLKTLNSGLAKTLTIFANSSSSSSSSSSSAAA